MTIDFSQPITPGSLLQAVMILVAAVGFFYGIRYRLSSVEEKVGDAIIELSKTRSVLTEIAKQSVRVEYLEKEIERMRIERK
jgi:hypothetical protein